MPDATDQPEPAARDLPAGLWCDVHRVLVEHGLDAAPVDVMMAVFRLIEQTPVERGGRLLPDGSVDQS